MDVQEMTTTPESYRDTDCLLPKESQSRSPPSLARHDSIQQENEATTSLLCQGSNEQQSPTSSTPHAVNQNKSFSVFQARAVSLAIMLLYQINLLSLAQVEAQYFHARFRPDFFNDSSSNVSYVRTDCSGNDSSPEALQEAALQEHVTQFMLYLSYASTGPMLAATLILGCWSDVIGRRSLIILSCTASFMRQIIIEVTMRLNLPLWLFYVSNVVDGLSGSYCTLMLGVFALTADITTPGKTRTFGIAMAEFFVSVGEVTAQLAVGYLLQNYGFFYGSLLPSVSVGCSVLVSIFFLPETRQRRHFGCVNPLKYLKNAFSFYIFEGSVRKRATFCLVLLVAFIAWVTGMSHSSIFTLYQLNRPFCFSPEQVGFYNAAAVGVTAVVGLAVLHTLQKHLSDTGMLFLSIISTAGQYTMEGLAQNNVMLYIAPVLGALNFVVEPVCRALLSKMAGAEKQGALFASTALVETICNIVSNTLYSSIYKATVAHFRGTVFLCMAAVVLLDAGLVLTLWRWFMRTERAASQNAIEQNQTI